MRCWLHDAVRRASIVIAQSLAHMAWVFATACLLEIELLAVQVSRALRWVCESNVQELANTAWAFATVPDWIATAG